ncbi:DUF1566 domain-containing protein [Desulfococcaceae bacterium HSG8]|nr:DUF1566 domain-containing protein [Desulfococcaceae bacterium HSG8]
MIPTDQGKSDKQDKVKHLEIYVNQGHSDIITCAAFSPDSRYILSGSKDGTLLLWDFVSDKEIRSFEKHDHPHPPTYIFFSPDGKYVLIGGTGYGIKLWEVDSGKMIAYMGDSDCTVSGPDGKYALAGGSEDSVKGHSEPVNCSVLSPDGKYILSGCEGNLRLHDAASGKEIRSSFKAKDIMGEFFSYGDKYPTGREKRLVGMPVFSPDGKYRLFQRKAGYGKFSAVICETASGKEISSYESGQQTRLHGVFSPDSRFMLLGEFVRSSGKPVGSGLYDTASGKKICSYDLFENGSAIFSPDRRYLAVYGIKENRRDRNVLRVVETASGKEVRSMGHPLPFGAADFSDNGRYILTSRSYVCRFKEISTPEAWDAVSGEFVCQFQPFVRDPSASERLILSFQSNKYYWYKKEDWYIGSVDRSPDEKYFLIGQHKLWDTDLGTEIGTFRKSDSSVRFSPDDRLVLSLKNSGMILWDVFFGANIRTFEGDYRETFRFISFSSDSRYIMSAGLDKKTLNIWDADSGKEVRSFRVCPDNSDSNIESAAFSPDGRYALTGMSSGELMMWDTDSGKGIRSFGNHPNGVTAVALSPDSKYALSRDRDSLILWDAGSGKEIRSYEEASGGESSGYTPPAIFSPDSRYVLSGSNRNMRLSETDSGKEICRFYAFSDEEWIVLTPGGFYNASPGGHKYLGVRVGDDLRGIENYKETFYRPGKVRKALQQYKEDMAGISKPVTPKPPVRKSSEQYEKDTGRNGSEQRGGNIPHAREPDKPERAHGKPEFITQLGHLREIECVALSPDGKYALSGGWDCMLKLWDVNSGREIRSFDTDPSFVISSVAFSPDGKYALSGSGAMRLWDVNSGREILSYQEDKADYHIDSRKVSVGVVRTVAFSPDGMHALAVTPESLELYETGSGKKVRTFIPEGYWIYFYSAAFSPDGKYILSGGADTVRLWDADSGKQIWLFGGGKYFSSFIESVAFSHDGRYALACGKNVSTYLLDISSGKRARSFSDSHAASVIFTSDPRHALLGGYERKSFLLDIFLGEKFRSFDGHQSGVRSAVLSSDGKYMLSGSCDRTMKLWEVSSGKEIRMFQSDDCGVRSAAFSPDGKYILAGYDDHTIMLWESESGKGIRSFPGHSAPVISVAFSPSSSYVLSAGKDRTLRVWETDSGKEIRNIEEYTDAVTGVMSSDGRYILSGRKLWDPDLGKIIRLFEKPGGKRPVLSPAFSPDSRYALSAIDNILWLWETASGKEVRSFKGHSSEILSAAFSSDGRYVLSGSRDKTLNLWAADSGKKIKTFRGHSDSVTCVSFSPDGRFVLSGSNDNTLKLWEADSGRELFTFRGHSKPVTSAAYDPLGRFVLSGSEDRTLRLWSTDSGKELCRFIAFKDEWVTLTPEGYYAASDRGSDCLSMSSASTSYDTRRYIKSFNHPEKVREKLGIPPKVPFKSFGKEKEPVFSERKYRIEKVSRHTLKIYSRETGREIFSHSIEDDPFGGVHRDYGEGRDFAEIRDYAVSPDEKYVLLVIVHNLAGLEPGDERIVRYYFHMFEIKTGKRMEHKLESGSHPDFTSDGKFIISGAIRMSDFQGNIVKEFRDPDLPGSSDHVPPSKTRSTIISLEKEYARDELRLEKMIRENRAWIRQHSPRTDSPQKDGVLSSEDVQAIISKYDRDEPYMPGSRFRDNGDGTVTDRKTGLMWDKSGGEEGAYRKAGEYIGKLNRQGFAGYNDWRIPMLEELVSLVESKTVENRLKISPVFDGKLFKCWSSDVTYYSSAWCISYSSGEISSYSRIAGFNRIHAVRSAAKSPDSKLLSTPHSQEQGNKPSESAKGGGPGNTSSDSPKAGPGNNSPESLKVDPGNTSSDSPRKKTFRKTVSKEELLNEIRQLLNIDDLSKLDRKSVKKILELFARKRLDEAHINAVIEAAPRFLRFQSEFLKTLSDVADGLNVPRGNVLEKIQGNLKKTSDILQNISEEMEKEDGRARLAGYAIKAFGNMLKSRKK